METTMDDVTVESENNSENNGDTPQEIEVEVETCRLCDEIGEKMYNIFDENPEGYQLIGLIKENLPIVLYKSDPLSKQLCEKCVEGLQIISGLKKRSRNTQEKYVEKLKNEADTHDKNVLLFLGCTGSKLVNNGDNEDDDEEEELRDECTSTDDLTVLCANCKTAILDASMVNGEVELGADLHKIIAESLRKNKVLTADSETEKVLRKRKIQPIYQELDDSLCSSLTDLTRRTAAFAAGDDESSQFASDIDSEDSSDERPPKRKKFDSESKKIQEEINEALAKQKEQDVEDDELMEDGVDPLEALEPEKVIDYVEMFEQEPDFTFEPLSLLQIALNSINVQNVPDFEAVSYIKISTACKCNTCGESFKNMKLLALHEFHHMDVDMEEKIDNPVPWPEDHPFSNVRNKWLTYFDENGYDEDDIVIEGSLTISRDDNSLLVEKSEKTMDMSKKDEVVLVNMKPMVNGIYLGDYTKEERKLFYQCMRIGGQTKRFCPLCRYCFKDNWAIESHYFSSACHYTCRYCGMRFNKQRHRFDEHVQKHREKEDPISDKIFTASKVNNTLPKIIQPNKVRRIVQVDPEQPREIKLEEYMSPQMVKNHEGRMRSMGGQPVGGPNAHGFVKIKEEPKDYVNSQNKSQNQAYFCRKCYKVFFKLDEFNAHSKSCDYNQFHTTPSYRNAHESSTPSPRPYQNNSPRANHNIPERRSNGEYTSTGRPIRNCVKDIGPYTDEVYIPKQLLNETVSSPAQGFICHICGTPFPTIYSRNSHMRIHKGEPGGPGSNMIMPHPPQNNILKQRLQQQQQHMQRANMQQRNIYQQPKQQNNYPQFEEIKIKQEPVDSFEPMVEIHEGHEEPPSPPQRYNTGAPPPRELGGGAVSITPINKNNTAPKQNLSPNIMKLVQNNPNISISKRPSEKAPQRHSTGSFGGRSGGGGNYNGNSSFQGPSYASPYAGGPNAPLNADDRSYKCSSCWEAFSNKSHLYFHKKNQCEGSRFPCPFCKKRFGTEAAYSSHIFYSHPE